MDNVSFIEGIDGVEMAIIDNGNDSFTSMTKAEYDKQAEQSTPSVTNGDQL